MNHEDANQVLLGIDEAVCAVAPSVAVAARREQRHSARFFLDNEPTESPTSTGLPSIEITGVIACHHFDRGLRKQPYTIDLPLVQHHLIEKVEVTGCRIHTAFRKWIPRTLTELHCSFAERISRVLHRFAVFQEVSGRHAVMLRLGWENVSVLHSERQEYACLKEFFKRHSRDDFHNAS